MDELSSRVERTLQNRLVAFVLAMIVIVPLGATPIDGTVRGVAAFTFEAFAILLLAALLWKARWDMRRETIVKFLRNGPNLPILLFLGLNIVSCLLSPQKAYSIQEVLKVGAGILLYFTITDQFRRSSNLTKLIDTLLFLGIASSIYGLAGFATSAHHFTVGMYGDHQLFGSFLMILLPILAVTAIAEKHPMRQLAAQGATVLTATCLLLSHTRSAWMGALAGIIALCTLALTLRINKQGRHTDSTAQKSAWLTPLLLILVATGFFMAAFPQSDGIVKRASTLQLATIDDENGWQYRLHMWQGTLRMIAQRPLTGFGVGMYPYYEEEYTGSGNQLTSPRVRGSLGEQAHNFYLQTAAELGVPGLLLMLAVIGTFLVTGFRRVRDMEAGIRRNILIGAMASVVAFAVDALGSPAWQFGQNILFFWLILGMGTCCMQPRQRERAAEPRPVPTRARRSAMAVCLGLASLLPTVVVAANGASYSDSTGVIVGVGVAAAVGVGFATAHHKSPELRIKSGDTLVITVANHPELSKFANPIIVQANGTANYPPLGDLNVVGAKRDELAAAIKKGLLKLQPPPITEADDVKVTIKHN